MQEALAGKKPGKGKTTHTALFGSIQNGYDDLDLPTRELHRRRQLYRKHVS